MTPKLQFNLIWLSLFLLSSIALLTPVKANLSLAEEDKQIILLITTPNMKPSGPVQGDYDRVKLALAKEYPTAVGGFSTVKMSFILYTNTEDVQKVNQVKSRVIELIPDAKIETLTLEEVKKLRL